MDKIITPATDIIILGGGVAGLTLALQLSMATPSQQITVLERTAFPVPEATHKVGESTVEIAAHYLRDVLGLSDHLLKEQLEKFGLRIFFTANGNTDVSTRPEIGHAEPPLGSVGTFQVDRGSLENYLWNLVAGQTNVKAIDGARVGHIEWGDCANGMDSMHTVTYETSEGSQRLSGRWLVDASGRASLLKRRFGIAKDVNHQASAAWIRVRDEIDIDQWSRDSAWHDRIVQGSRRLSTNHLMGRGYWVWIIPLATGYTSIGIVADSSIHDFEHFNSRDRFMSWISAHEPQLARSLYSREALISDFKVMKNYSHSAEKVFCAEEGWFITGEAGVFLDPLYSPGIDLIAISNGLIVDLIRRAGMGEDVREVSAIHNQTFLTISEGWLEIYRDQGMTMSSPRAMTAKIIWDTAAYWAVPGFLYFHDLLPRLAEFPDLVVGMARFQAASIAVQQFFRGWASVDDGEVGQAFVSLYDFTFMQVLHDGIAAALETEAARASFLGNVTLIGHLSGQMVYEVLARFESDSATVQQRAMARTWRSDEQLMELVRAYQTDESGLDTDPGWIWREPGRSTLESKLADAGGMC